MPTNAEFSAPGTLEERIGRVWADFLNGVAVRADTDFFAAGGSSLRATEATSRLREELGKDLPFDLIFQYPVLQDAAQAAASAADLTERAITPAPMNDRTAATAAQTQLLLHAQLSDDATAYNISWAYRGAGTLDEPVLRAALDDVVARHESLRTVVDDEDGIPMLTVLSECPAGYFAVMGAEAEEASAIVDEVRTTEFDLAAGPLHRTTLIRLPNREFILVFVAHHVIFDAWSSEIIHRDLTTAYRAHASQGTLRWERLPLRYRDFAHWQAHALASGAFDAHRQFWAAELAAATPDFPLPLRQARSAARGSVAHSVPIALDPLVSARLRSITAATKTTLFVVLLTVFGLGLHQQEQMPEVTVGVPAAGRTKAELNGVVGLFVNSLPIRMDFSGAATPHEQIGRVKNTVLAALRWQDLPFGGIVQTVNPPRVPGRNPLFQVWFDYDHPPESLALTGVRLQPLRLPELTARFDLALHMREDADHLAGELTYRSSLLDTPAVRMLAENIQRAAELLAYA